MSRAKVTVAQKTGAPALGWRVYGVSVMMLGLVSLAWRDFDYGQPVAGNFPGRAGLALAADVFMVIAGAASAWGRTAAWGGAALFVYYALVVVVLDGLAAVGHFGAFGTYSGDAAQVAVAAAGLIVFAEHVRIDPALAARLIRIGRWVFGFCAILFGGAHFVYLSLTTPLIPSWLPFPAVFWAYGTGVAHIAAGAAILTGVQARPAAILLTVMYGLFTPLVHAPALLAHPARHWTWSEAALNLVLTAVAWVVADSLDPRRASRSCRAARSDPA